VREWYGIPAGGASRLGAVRLGALLLTAAPAMAAAQVDSGTFVVHDFRFADGQTLPELRLHYLTLGRPDQPAVLILHGTGGSHRQFLAPIFAGELFGAGQPLDTAAHFIILADGIGHGASSKPSDGLHARFPHYTYDDMVRAQYRLVTERLRLQHLRLVLGTSMGCMHAWIWAETYPSFMDGIVPLACAPAQIAGRNRLWRKLAMDAIRSDPGWKGGGYTAQPAGLGTVQALVLMVSGSPTYYHRLAPTRDSADAYLDGFRRRMREGGFADANDALYALDASRDYDPSPGLDRITTRVLAINFADDQVNPPELGIMERLMPRVKRARYILVPADERTVGHGTHTKAAVWKEYLKRFLREFPEQRPRRGAARASD
jgi:homoserine O-acetyltransferase